MQPMTSLLLKITFAIVILASINMPEAVRAQEKPFEIGFKLFTGIPMGDFSEHIGSPGFGLEGHYGYRIPNTPVTIGYELSYFNYGRHDYTETLTPDLFRTNRVISTRNNMTSLHLLVRLGPQYGMIRPYIDGLFGLNYLYTRSHIRDNNIFDDDQKYSLHHFDDTVLSYGAGAGFRIKVQEVERLLNPDSKTYWYLDLRAVYQRGGSARYLLQDSLIATDGTMIFSPERSHTDILSLQVGFSLFFSGN